MATRAVPGPVLPGRGGASIRTQIKEGVTFVWRESVLRSLMSSYTVNVVFIGAFQAVVILFMARTLGLSGSAIGIAYAIGNMGFVVGALVSRRLARATGLGYSVISGLGLVAAGFLVTAAASASMAVPVLAAGQFISSFGLPIYNVNFVTLRQAMTPNDLMGRVSSVSRVLGRGMAPLGALLGAGLVTAVGPRTTLAVAGLGGLLALVPAIRGSIAKVRSVSDLRVAQ
jgi:predicted MFS family arabinose efflux permease